MRNDKACDSNNKYKERNVEKASLNAYFYKHSQLQAVAIFQLWWSRSLLQSSPSGNSLELRALVSIPVLLSPTSPIWMADSGGAGSASGWLSSSVCKWAFGEQRKKTYIPVARVISSQECGNRFHCRSAEKRYWWQKYRQNRKVINHVLR